MHALFRDVFVACTAFAAVSGFGQSSDPLVQPRVQELLDRAERSLQSGSFSEAMACTEAVLLKPTLNVNVKVQGLSDSESDQAEAVVSDALSAWEEALGYEVVFLRSEANEADVTISFAPSVRHLGREVAGVANWSRQVYNWGGTFSTRVSADIKVRTTTIDGAAMSAACLKHATMHELGHVLGLSDSARVGDLMGPMDVSRPATGPSDRELSTLLGYRSRAVSAMQACLTATSSATFRASLKSGK